MVAGAIMGINPKARKWVLGRHGWERKWKEKLQAADITAGQTLVWMHAASLGEFEQGSPLIEEIKKQYPGVKVVITFFSPSGYEVRKNYAGADVVGYLPFDGPLTAPAFVKMLEPSLVIWVKYDYWYYTLQAIYRRQIPLLLISGMFRPSQPFFKWYGKLHREMLQFFSHLFVQNDNAVALLKGVVKDDKVTVSGDTRFDAVLRLAENWQPNELVAKWLKQSPLTVVAGSTWPSDEEEMVHFIKSRPDIKWIIAPHNLEEDMLQDTLQLLEQPTRYSQLGKERQETPALSNVLLIDNVGMLRYLYKYGTVCYLGGGFTGSGIHNVLEAAVYGKPVIHGPEFSKYAEATGLLEAGGSFVVSSALTLESKLEELLGNPEKCADAGSKAESYVRQQAGAASAIMLWIQANLRFTNEKNR